MLNSIRKHLLSIVIGLLIVMSVFYISVQSDKKQAYKILDSTTSYIKEQSNRYIRIRLSSESKSLTRLIESARNVGKVADIDNLEELAKENDLTGILLLNEKGDVVSSYSLETDISYLKDEYLKSKSLLDTLDNSKKQYAIRYSDGSGGEVDIAAIAHSDKSHIVVVYFHSLQDYKDSFSLSIASLLSGFEMENSETILVSDRNTIIASNDESLIGKDPASLMIINKISESNSNKNLLVSKTDLSSNQRSFGLMKQGQNIDVYAYMPEREIYKKTPLVLMATTTLYIFVIAMINRTKSKADDAYREEQLKLQEEYNLKLKEKNAQLKEAVYAANRANAAKTNFLSSMSHDIRTPINGIVGLIKINQDHFDDKDFVYANLEKMKLASNHLLALINDVLQMSKIEDGSVQLAHEFIDFRKLSNEIYTIIQEKAVENNIKLEFDYNVKKSFPYVYGSPVHIRQVFLNLYTNSIKYNNPGGKISTRVDVVNFDNNKCMYKWVIEDSGIGMNEEFVKKIFEPFTQENSDARSVYQGVGLGMSIVKGLIEKMGGTITVFSKENVGTKYVLEIPFDVANVKDNPIYKETIDYSIKGFSLLMAEDNELNAEIAEVLLQDAGAKVKVVSNGLDALEAFKNAPKDTYDAILMDLMMPEMDGVCATRKIRALDRDDAKTIPIIAMTANAFIEDRDNCMKAGMSDYISKPLNMDVVKEVICNNCRK